MRNYFYITGTSSGLGKAIAEAALKDRSTTVFGFARRCTITYENYIHNAIDLSDLNAVKEIQFQQHPDADKIILINNAGTGSDIKYLGELDPDKIISGYQVNTIAPHLLMNNFLSAYRLNNCEKIIINITSGAASNAYDGWSIYCATKAAIDMMSLVADKEQQIRNTGFKIFAIAPGVLDTPMQDQLRKTEAHNFSRISKFKDLKDSNQLADPYLVAEKIIAIVRNPAQLSGVIQRIQL